MGYAKEHGIEAICFDIDGTFYPKWKMDLKVFKASIFHVPFAIRYNKLRQLIRQEDGYQNLAPMSYEEISKRAALFFYSNDSKEFQEKFRKKEKSVFLDSYLRQYARLKSAPGVMEALELAKTNGYKMAALSDFPIGVKLNAMKIEKFFDAVLSSEDLGHFKPSRTPFVALCNSLGVKEDKVLYVGDSYKKDVLGAKNAGMHTCLMFAHDGDHDADICSKDWSDFIRQVF